MHPSRRHHLVLVCLQLEQLVFDTEIVDFLVIRHVIVDFATLQSASIVHYLVVAMMSCVYCDLPIEKSKFSVFYSTMCDIIYFCLRLLTYVIHTSTLVTTNLNFMKVVKISFNMSHI